MNYRKENNLQFIFPIMKDLIKVKQNFGELLELKYAWRVIRISTIRINTVTVLHFVKIIANKVP